MATINIKQTFLPAAQFRGAHCHLSLVLTVLLMVAMPLQATQPNPNYRLCFPPVVGVPVLGTPPTDPCGHIIVSGQPPNIDGCITGDPGWAGAFRYVDGTSTPFTPNAAVQGNRDSQFLYLSVEVNNDLDINGNPDHLPDLTDAIVLLFSPSNGTSPTDDRRIVIYPNASPLAAHYWKDSSLASWTQPTTVPPPGVRIAATQNGSSWYVEIAIPLTGVNSYSLPTTGDFGFYFDIIRAIYPFSPGGGGATEYYWPSLSGNGIGNGNEETTAKPLANWGRGSLDLTACNGVSLIWTDITSNHSTDQIDRTCKPGAPDCSTQGNQNTFTAVLRNNTIDGSGNPAAVQGIMAKFSIADFGLPSVSSWMQIPVAGNPVGPVTILASNTRSVTTPPWQISDPGLIANFSDIPDQCILVDLDSETAGITFINKSARRNMMVFTASEVTKKARISAKGYPPHPEHKTQQEFLLQISRRQEVLQGGKRDLGTAAQAPIIGNVASTHEGKIHSRLTWVVRGCRLTGEYIIVNGQRLNTCEDIGAFGAIADHFAAAAIGNWQVDMEGPGLSKVKNSKNSYRLMVPQDGTATVTLHFKPVESKWAGFLDLGANIPHGTLGNGFSLNAGLEYMVNSYVSAEGIFGYHHFPAKGVSQLPAGLPLNPLTDQNIYQLSGNVKFYLGPPHSISSITFQPFANTGPGVYKFSPGPWKFGGNLGVGGLFQLTSRFGLQASYNFHAVNTSGTLTKFSTLQGGIRFLF